MSRTVFRIHKVSAPGQSNRKEICYGDKVRISANSRLLGQDKIVYLTSGHCSTQSFAKLSHYQEVSFTSQANSFATIWEFDHVDAKVRFEMVGEQISVDDQILLKHAHTSNWLGSESSTFKNTYGPEMEVFVHSFYDTKKTQN
jgi:hypothetical protein